MLAYEQLTRRGQIRRLRRAAEQALPRYGIEPVALSLLAHSYNTTFTVIGSDCRRYVLHILRPVDDELPESQRRARVESELWWLDRVSADLNLPVPVPVRTPGGEVVVSLDGEGDEPARMCTLFRWIDGRLARHRLTPARLEAVGVLTARLHGLSERLQVPAWFDRPTVDAADAETEEESTGLFTDHVSAEAGVVMREVLRRVRRAKEELGSGPDSFGVIHADIHQHNYLFRGREVRLIDFGDCGWGHYLYDPAVTIHQIGDVPQRSELGAALLTGYRRVRDLSAEHEALIDTFIMLRELQDLTWDLKFRDDPAYGRTPAQIEKGVAMLKGLLRATA